jgi:hypothetical protein
MRESHAPLDHALKKLHKRYTQEIADALANDDGAHADIIMKRREHVSKLIGLRTHLRAKEEDAARRAARRDGGKELWGGDQV